MKECKIMKGERFRFRWWVVGAGLWLSGCVSTPDATPSPRPVPSTDVGRLQAWQDAEQVSARQAGRETVIGSGDSMRPIYGDRTVLVLAPIDYANLKAGMQIGYVNRHGRRVVHVLLAPGTDGWRVQGLNNESEDRERVTRYNLIGVVYASFATDGALR
jgi:hypothetical protein